MKNWKRIFALLLAAALCLSLLAACGSSGTASEDTASEETAEETAVEEEPAEEAAEESAETEEPAEEEAEETETEEAEITTLYLWLYDIYNSAEHAQKVIDAINDLSEERYGIHVEITWADAGTYTQQLPISLAGGERVDICALLPVPVVSVATMYANGELMEVSSLLQEYAPDAYSMMEDYLGAYTYGGGLYGLPTYKNWATNNYIIMRQDVLEELDMVDFAKNMTTWSEYESLLAAVYEQYNGDVAPVCNSTSNVIMRHNGYFNTISDNFADYVAFDTIGDSLYALTTDNEGHVSSFYEDERFVSDVAKVAEWQANGWIYGDAAFTDETGDTLMLNGVAFSDLDGGEIGIETRKRTACGQEMVCTMTSAGYIKTSLLTSWGIGIPYTCEEPEAAARFINAMYTDAELLNLFVYGIEGEDYVITETGEIDYPEGIDASNREFQEADWMLGNQFMLHCWAGDGADYREVAEAENSACDVSPYLGFALDTTGMDTLLASLTAVTTEYEATIKCGGYTEELYSEFIAALKTAGIDDYVAAAQEQLDAFLAG